MFVRRWGAPILVGLIAFECLIRTLICSPRPVVDDPVLGTMPAPHSTWVTSAEAFRGTVRWSREGLRGRDLPVTGRSSPVRVLVLGDSFTEARQVGDRETFCAKLETELSRRLGTDVWVGNGGRNGCQAADYLYYAPAYVRRFKPDLLVLAFSPGDFRQDREGRLAGNMARFHPNARDEEALTYQLPRLRSAGSLEAVRSTLYRSALVVYAADRMKALAQGETGSLDTHAAGGEVASSRVMQQYLTRLVRATPVPILCTLLAPDNELRPFEFEREESRLRDAAVRTRVPFVETSRRFRQQFGTRGVPGNGFDWSAQGPGFGHLNPVGHALVAQTLASPVADLLGARRTLSALRSPLSVPNREQRAESRELPHPPRTAFWPDIRSLGEDNNHE